MPRTRSPRARRAGYPFLAAAGLLVACGSGEAPPSILLLTLDTTRFDALSCYGGEGASTSNLDRLAGEGILFEAAFTSAPLTLPAHASLLTGLYPIRHGVRDNGMGALPRSARTLAEHARDADYRTAAFVAAVVLDDAFGLDQGFERYDAPDPAQAGEHGQRPARDVVDRALGWLDGLDAGEPFLLWLHFYDPHTPYEPRPDALGCELPILDASNRSRYLREVCGMDGEIGRLFAALESSGAWRRTIVLAVGDHGEAFGEHGEFGHSAHCFDTTLRVPMLLRLPDGSGAGTRRSDVVSVVDVLPSLLAGAGIGRAGGPRIDGLDVLEAPAPAERGVYFESYYGYLSFGWSPIAGWLDRDGKYVHTSEPEFYDLRADPGELDSRFADPPVDLRRYQRGIAELADAPRLAADGEGGAGQDLLEGLRGLGYAAVGAVEEDLPHPLARSELPSPSRMAGPYERSIEALAMTQRGEVAQAIPILEEVRSVNARNPVVLELLANCLIQEKRYAEAAGALRDLVDFALTDRPGAWARLGAVLLQLGQEKEGIEALERSLELAPGKPIVLRELIEALQRAGRTEEAAARQRELGAQGN